MMELTATGTIGALTFVLATLLVWANRRLHVEEDPRIDIVEQMLPLTNCGGCGYPGCRPFAEALVAGKVLPGGCNVSTEEGRAGIAEFLGVDVGAQEKQVARLACAGGSNVARNRARYDGMSSCRAAGLCCASPAGLWYIAGERSNGFLSPSHGPVEVGGVVEGARATRRVSLRLRTGK